MRDYKSFRHKANVTYLKIHSRRFGLIEQTLRDLPEPPRRILDLGFWPGTLALIVRKHLGRTILYDYDLWRYRKRGLREWLSQSFLRLFHVIPHLRPAQMIVGVKGAGKPSAE